MPWPPCRWWRCPRCPHRKNLAEPNVLLCRGYPVLWIRGQLEEDWGPSPVCTPRRVPPSPQHHRTELKVGSQFTYLGCTITSDAKIDREVNNRLAKANCAFGKLYKRLALKINVYRAVILITLLYGSESWVTYRYHLRLLERLHQRCLRTILNIHWSNYVSNVEVLD